MTRVGYGIMPPAAYSDIPDIYDKL